MGSVAIEVLCVLRATARNSIRTKNGQVAQAPHGAGIIAIKLFYDGVD